MSLSFDCSARFIAKLMVLIFILQNQSCYFDFRPGRIDDSLKTFSVYMFDVKAGAAPATSGQDFSELLKAKLLNRTNLAYNNQEGDLSFSGTIVQFEVQPLAAKPDETTALQRLNMSVSVNCTNRKDKEKSWKQTFRRFADFSSDENLFDVQEALITSIYEQIITDLFNKMFADW